MQPKIIEFWHAKLSRQALSKPSLQFLSCPFLSLGRGPHLLWQSCGSSRSAVRVAAVQAKMISGRYRTDSLSSKWLGGDGHCLLPGCVDQKGDIVHLFSGKCPALYSTLTSSVTRGLLTLQRYPQLLPPVVSALSSLDPLNWVRFILDPSTDALVIKIRQESGNSSLWPLFKFSRTVIWAVHKKRLQLKGQLRSL